MTIPFRAHHFLCTAAFRGTGYSPEFVQQYMALVEKLAQEEGTTRLEVVEDADAICQPCPHRTGTKCASQTRIQQLDERHGMVLGLAPGDQLTWAEARRRLAELVSLDRFHWMCSGCRWKKLGVCETTLVALHQEFQTYAFAPKQSTLTDTGHATTSKLHDLDLVAT